MAVIEERQIASENARNLSGQSKQFDPISRLWRKMSD
jgi:hypothetical protein